MSDFFNSLYIKKIELFALFNQDSQGTSNSASNSTATISQHQSTAEPTTSSDSLGEWYVPNKWTPMAGQSTQKASINTR